MSTPSMGNVQISDGWHRRNKCGEVASQRIACDVPAAPNLSDHAQSHNPKRAWTWACSVGVFGGVTRGAGGRELGHDSSATLGDACGF